LIKQLYFVFIVVVKDTELVIYEVTLNEKLPDVV